MVSGHYDDIISEFEEGDDIEMFDGTKVTKEQLKTDRLVKTQFIKELIEDFIGGFTLTLPEPNTTKVENLADLYHKQSDFIEEGLKAWLLLSLRTMMRRSRFVRGRGVVVVGLAVVVVVFPCCFDSF